MKTYPPASRPPSGPATTDMPVLMRVEFSDGSGREMRLTSETVAQAFLERFAPEGVVGVTVVDWSTHPAPTTDEIGADLLDERRIAAVTRIALPEADLDDAGASALGEAHDPGHPHLYGGLFQSDKYPTTPRGCVPLKPSDPTAQDLLWEYAQRRRAVDAEFASDLERALQNAGYTRPSSVADEMLASLEAKPGPVVEVEISQELMRALSDNGGCSSEDCDRDRLQLENDANRRRRLELDDLRSTICSRLGYSDGVDDKEIVDAIERLGMVEAENTDQHRLIWTLAMQYWPPWAGGTHPVDRVVDNLGRIESALEKLTDERDRAQRPRRRALAAVRKLRGVQKHKTLPKRRPGLRKAGAR